MKKVMILILAAASINLTACSSMRGNVVPQSGPTMEQVYDGTAGQNNSNMIAASHQDNLNKVRNDVPEQSFAGYAHHSATQPFRKLPNPELQIYITPHLAGKDQVPVPGYYTAFNVYPHDYYALPQE